VTTTGEDSHTWGARGKISRHLRTQHSGIESHDHKREAKYKFLDETRDDPTDEDVELMEECVRMLRHKGPYALDVEDYEDHPEIPQAKKI